MQLPEVPAPPPPAHEALVSSLSPILMIAGVILVLCALPPVRHGVARMVQTVELAFRPAARTAARSGHRSSDPAAELESQPDSAASSRREIEEFDLSVFER